MFNKKKESAEKVPNPKEEWGYYIRYEPCSSESFFVIITKMTEWDFDDFCYVGKNGYLPFKPKEFREDYLFYDLQIAESRAKEVIETIKRKKKMMDGIRYKNSFPSKIADL